MVRPHDAELEEVEDAIVDGDVAYQRGTAQAALRHRNFRIVYLGTFASNIGTWMQTVTLGAFALKLSGSPSFVGLIFFAQLGPLLFLSTTGGLLADILDRRRLLVTAQFVMMAFSFALAALALLDDPPKAGLVALVFAIGIANSIGAPGLERDPADARAARGPRRRDRAPVGADEPVPRHRPGDRRRALRDVRRGAGVRDQRAHVRLRDHRAAVGDVPASRERAGRRARAAPVALGRDDRPPRSAA